LFTAEDAEGAEVQKTFYKKIAKIAKRRSPIFAVFAIFL